MPKIYPELVECKICKKSFAGLATHINRSHQLSGNEYLKRFPGAQLMSKNHKQKISDSMKDRFLKDPTLKQKVSSRTFDFIKNKNLTPLLQRDYKSAKICLKNSLWKPSIILYGSIIEAIFIEKYPKAKVFYNALNEAYSNEDISEIESHKIHIIRDLRNYVHLHKELLDDNGEINEHWAKTAADICESIIKRFNRSK